MKQLCVLLLLLFAILDTNAQNLCDGHETPLGGMPDELYRGRLKKDGALYGNPYTMMDRTKYPVANDGFMFEMQDL
jgi:hypothetical protein